MSTLWGGVHLLIVVVVVVVVVVIVVVTVVVVLVVVPGDGGGAVLVLVAVHLFLLNAWFIHFFGTPIFCPPFSIHFCLKCFSTVRLPFFFCCCACQQPQRAD
jgi:hypothetical protein